jgi:tungstate transport system substrate-binding protein
MTIRRSLLALSLLGPVLPGAQASQRKSMADPLRLGVERSLVESGLVERLLRAFAQYSGLKVLTAPGTSAQVLGALEQGEVDAALTDAPELEVRLEKQGLAHDRQAVASGDLVLVGPARAAGGRDIASALAGLARAEARFVGAAEGSGAHLAELALWREAKVAPAAPWYVKTPAGENAMASAAAQGGCTLVERGLWQAKGRKPLAVLVEGDPRMAIPVHVMRSFRVNHPAAKLFVQWVSGPQGGQAAQAAPGWRGPTRR